MELEMSRYKRRLIYASIAIHVFALLGYFIYWLNTDPFAEKEQTIKSGKVKQA